MPLEICLMTLNLSDVNLDDVALEQPLQQLHLVAEEGALEHPLQQLLLVAEDGTLEQLLVQEAEVKRTCTYYSESHHSQTEASIPSQLHKSPHRQLECMEQPVVEESWFNIASQAAARDETTEQ